MRYRIVNVFYLPGADGVTIAVKPEGGPPALAKAGTIDVFTTQAALQALAPAGTLWGDAEVIAEATRLLSTPDWPADVLGYEPPPSPTAVTTAPPLAP